MTLTRPPRLVSLKQSMDILQLFRWNSCNEILPYRKSLLLGKTIFSVRQKGVPPLLLPASVLQLPRCLVRICNLFLTNHKIADLTVSKNAIAAGKTDCKIEFAPQMWATRPHLGSIFEKLLHRKTFYFACGSYLNNPPRKNLPRTIPQTAIPFNTATKPHFPQFPVFLRLTNFRKSPIIKSVPIEQLYARRFGNAAHFIR